MVSEPNFNFEDTMTSFELMDLKMDLRVQKDKIAVDNKPQYDELESWTHDCLT